MLRFIATVLLALMLLSGTILAVDNSKNEPGEISRSRPVMKVNKVLEEPEKHLGGEIVVVGMFLGHDGKCSRPPMFKGAAWMLQDDTNTCLYVHGDMPEGFSCSERIGLGVDIAVQGFLKKSGERYYLKSALGMGNLAEKRDEAKTALREITRKQAMNKMAVLTASDVVTGGELLQGKIFFAKGLYRSEQGCDYPAPEAEVPVWAIEDLSSSCIYVSGPPPAPGGTPAREGALVSFKAMAEEYEIENDKKATYLVHLLEENRKPASGKDTGEDSTGDMRQLGAGEVIDFRGESAGE